MGDYNQDLKYYLCHLRDIQSFSYWKQTHNTMPSSVSRNIVIIVLIGLLGLTLAYDQNGQTNNFSELLSETGWTPQLLFSAQHNRCCAVCRKYKSYFGTRGPGNDHLVCPLPLCSEVLLGKHWINCRYYHWTKGPFLMLLGLCLGFLTRYKCVDSLDCHSYRVQLSYLKKSQQLNPSNIQSVSWSVQPSQR